MPCEEVIKSRIDMALKAIRLYDWLINMYVLDFFVDCHWNKLPESWKKCFIHLDPQELGRIINGAPTGHMFPLSFIALLQTVNALKIPRQNFERDLDDVDKSAEKCVSHPKLKNLFLKHVKLKKRHEISLMAKVVNDTASKSHCGAVIDFGSGLGHLVRMLGYKYNLFAAGIECQSQLTMEARKLDLELEYTAKKHLAPAAMSDLRRPTHLNITLSSQEQLSDLVPTIMRNYGLIGLHPCGDLGPLLLRHFVYNDKVKFICLVGCCYMKLSSEGYPMSQYVQGLDSDLSYTSKEIACHAIESYCERLMNGNYEDLKIHAYRAALESILVGINPKLKHAKVRSIKHTESMTFEKYCALALDKLDIPLPSQEAYNQGEELLCQWRQVLTVYTLRLSIAPLVETIVLLDRVLFVLEKGMSCEIRPVFDPKLSPRNHIVIGRR